MDKTEMRLGRITLAAAVIGALGSPGWADSRSHPLSGERGPEAASLDTASLDTVPSSMSSTEPSATPGLDSAEGSAAEGGAATGEALVGSVGPLPRPMPRPAAQPRPVAYEMPDLRWDHVRGSGRWTRAAMRAIDSHGKSLIDTVPRDIAEWCPAYPQASDFDRKVFWVGLLSTLSKHESTYRQTAVGGGGLWYGLVQILPATARGYGCEARSGEALKDGELNMSCAVRIMDVTVPRDGVVSRGMRGVAADWGPFHSARKREDMRTWIRAQPFCNGLTASARPVMRPDRPGSEPEDVPLFVAWELDKQFHDTPSWSGYVVAGDRG